MNRVWIDSSQTSTVYSGIRYLQGVSHQRRESSAYQQLRHAETGRIPVRMRVSDSTISPPASLTLTRLFGAETGRNKTVAGRDSAFRLCLASMYRCTTITPAGVSERGGACEYVRAVRHSINLGNTIVHQTDFECHVLGEGQVTIGRQVRVTLFLTDSRNSRWIACELRVWISKYDSDLSHKVVHSVTTCIHELRTVILRLLRK